MFAVMINSESYMGVHGLLNLCYLRFNYSYDIKITLKPYFLRESVRFKKKKIVFTFYHFILMHVIT